MVYSLDMTLAHVTRMDLNLLLALHALLEERSVTRAATRLGLTQSATSRALARLRTHLDDPVLVRGRAGMVPTPRALALGPGLRRALEDLDALVGASRAFDPASATRTVHLATVDYAVAVLVPPLLARVAREAPGVSVVVHPLRADVSEQLEAGALDVVVTARRRAPAGVVWSALFEDRFVTVARRGHPRVGSTLSLERFCQLGHVVVDPEGRHGTSAVDDELGRTGRTRRVVLRVPGFVAVPPVVADSELIATLPERLARRFVEAFQLHVVKTPVALPPLRIALGWHERARHDPGHVWFRRLLTEVARALP